MPPTTTVPTVAIKNILLAVVSIVVFVVMLTGAIFYVLRSDRVVLSNTSGSENGILVDGESALAVLVYQGSASTNSTFKVGLLHNAPGNNEVIAFTNRRPVAIAPSVDWTPPQATVNLPFSNQIQIAVTVWIVRGTFKTQHDRVAQFCIDTVAAWDAERMGVAFAPGGCDDIRDATTDPPAAQFANFQCSNQENLQTKIGKVAGRINIYVVGSVKAGGSWAPENAATCSDDFITLGSNVDSTVLTHELGHTFSLTHSDGWPHFDDTNFMYSQPGNRQYFTEGQLFRAHFSTTGGTVTPSALNDVYNARPGQPTRNCDWTDNSDTCPSIDKRIWADGSGFPPN
jgi:hypothetical protein